jgi:hypothetical protein
VVGTKSSSLSTQWALVDLRYDGCCGYRYKHPNIVSILGTHRSTRKLTIFLEYASDG